MKAAPMVLSVQDTSLMPAPAVQALQRMAQEPDVGLAVVMQNPGLFAEWLAPGANRALMESWHAQAWQAMAQDTDRFHRWLGWWGERWAQHVVREAPAEDPANEPLVELLPMAVWGRPSPALPDDQPWSESVLAFWRRLGEHDHGWFERPVLGSLSSQHHELDGLGYNPHQETVTNVLGVAVVHGRTHAINAWTTLGASWDRPPKGLKSHTVSPLIVALTRADAADQPAVQGLGLQGSRWGQTWGHANTSQNQGAAWKPAWLMRTARGTVWDLAVQHPDERVRHQAFRAVMGLRPAARNALMARSSLPEAVWRAHLCAAEALVLNEHCAPQSDDVDPIRAPRPRTRL